MVDTHQRFVVYLDLLGFSRFVLDHSVDEVLAVYDRLFRAVLHSWCTHAQEVVEENLATGRYKRIAGSSLCKELERVGCALDKGEPIDSKAQLDRIFAELLPFKIIILSDSIAFISGVVATLADRLTGLEMTVAVAREFVAMAFLHGLPARGAVTLGECYVDEDRSIFFGKAFLEAIALEQQQEWIGCSVGKSLDPVIKEYKEQFEKAADPIGWRMCLLGPISSHSMRWYQVPTKGGEFEEFRIINWAGAIYGKIKIHADMFKQVLTGQTEHDIKWHNTYAYLDWWRTKLEDQTKTGKLIF